MINQEIEPIVFPPSTQPSEFLGGSPASSDVSEDTLPRLNYLTPRFRFRWTTLRQPLLSLLRLIIFLVPIWW